MSSSGFGPAGRRVPAVALERMADDPVLLLEGPRSVGKSTLLREIANLRGARILDLDDLATRDAVAADPGTMIVGDQPVCIDEYQKAPVVLDAIKAELNPGATPGRFVLTGSTRHDSLPRAAQALTGRLRATTGLQARTLQGKCPPMAIPACSVPRTRSAQDESARPA